MLNKSRVVFLIVSVVFAACAQSPGEGAAPPSQSVPGTTTATDATTTSAAPIAPVTTAVPRPSSTTSIPVAADGFIVETITRLEAGTGGVALGQDGTLYVADWGETLRLGGGQTVYAVGQDGAASPLIEGQGLSTPSGNVVAADGFLYQSSFSNGRVHRITSSGQAEQVVEGLRGPVGVAVAEDETIFVAECRGNALAKIQHGVITELARGAPLACPNGVALGEGGVLYVANFSNGEVIEVQPDGSMSVLAELPGGNLGHLAVHEGWIYVLARGANQIFRVSQSGDIELVAGKGEVGESDGTGEEATFNLLNGIAIADDGTIYVNQAAGDSSDLFPSVVRRIRVP